jgi:hypothetical protein
MLLIANCAIKKPGLQPEFIQIVDYASIQSRISAENARRIVVKVGSSH